MKVFTTGMPVFCARRRSCSDARFRTAPLPARITGFFASAMMSTAALTALWSAAGRRVLRTVSGSIASISRSAMSSGSSMTQAPGFSASATLNALRMTSGTVSGL